MSDTSIETIEKAMQRLRQGLMTGSASIVADAHRALYDAVPQSVPYIVADLRALKLDQVGRGEVTRLAVGLAALLHDVDEQAARKFFEAADRRPVHPAIQAGFRSIRRFAKDNYRRSSHLGIDIYEHKSLPVGAKSASDRVRAWLQHVPVHDLAGVSRIYLSETDESADYLGTYLPGLAVINVLWDAAATKYWVYRFTIQRTLYHEIGHHAHKHKLGGQDPVQEDEAEIYADRMIRRAYPSLGRTASLVRWLRGRPPPEK